MKHVFNIVNKLTSLTVYFAQFALAFAMLLIVANVILRIRWSPVPGSVELVEMSGAVLLSMAVAYTAIQKGHIMVGVLVDKFSKKLQAAINAFVSMAALTVILLLAKEAFSFAARMMSRGYVTGHLNIPIAPSIYIVGIGFAMLCMVLLLDLISAVLILAKKEDGK